jgi:hypothetical protein
LGIEDEGEDEDEDEDEGGDEDEHEDDSPKARANELLAAVSRRWAAVNRSLVIASRRLDRATSKKVAA